MSYVNIQKGAGNFNVPMPFQHFTGDYATATQISTVTVANSNVCDALCKNSPTCEFYKFLTPSSCQLFNATSGSNITSGIKINRDTRNIGMSNIYSVQVPSTVPISSNQTQNSEACENSCNLNSMCYVYGFDLSTSTCTLYGTTLQSGNVGVSRDLK
jgi:hypothetical protein